MAHDETQTVSSYKPILRQPERPGLAEGMLNSLLSSRTQLRSASNNLSAVIPTLTNPERLRAIRDSADKLERQLLHIYEAAHED